MIIEALEANGVPVHEVIATGGLAEKSPLIMQIYADVTGRTFKLSGVRPDAARWARRCSVPWRQVPAAGGYATIEDAAAAMARLSDRVYEPNPRNRAIYDVLYAEYVRLHDYFGRGENNVMKTLRGLRARAKAEVG